MKTKLKVGNDYKVVRSLPTCIHAIFYSPGNNPFFPISATDERGTFFGLEYTDTRPFLVEILHSKPGVIRGNHIHLHCTEIFTVLSGRLDMYLLCPCPEKHLYKRSMLPGATVKIPSGIAHAIHVQTRNESTAIFHDNDPRQDRDHVELLSIQ